MTLMGCPQNPAENDFGPMIRDLLGEPTFGCESKLFIRDEHQNRWYMGVHPPQNGGIGYDPWPFMNPVEGPLAKACRCKRKIARTSSLRRPPVGQHLEFWWVGKKPSEVQQPRENAPRPKPTLFKQETNRFSLLWGGEALAMSSVAERSERRPGRGWPGHGAAASRARSHRR